MFIIIAVILSVYVLSMLALLFWGFFTSLKDQTMFRNDVLGLPEGAPWEWKWSNYVDVYNNFHEIVTIIGVGRRKVFLPEMIRNTLLYAVGCSVMQTLAPLLMAYITTRFPNKFSSFINTLVIALMILPIVGSAPAEMNMLRTLGLYDSIIGLWICKFGFLGMYFLIFSASIKGVPKDFYEAAYVDGASELRVMVTIAFPMIFNVIATVFLLKFIVFWNDYQTPLLYMPSYPVFARGVFRLSQGSQGVFATIPYKIAGCMLLALPMLVMFILFKDKLMGNLTMGGVKE